jgi:hypothetical protein
MSRQLEGILFIVVLVGLVFGAMLGFYAWQQWKLFSQGDAVPQVISLADLERNGPGANIHVTVTDLVLAPKYVVETKNNRWNRVWVPMFRSGQGEGRGDIKVVARNFDINDERQLEGLYHQRQLTGVIVNSVWGLASSELEYLQKNMPGVDFSSALVFDVGRSFPTRGGIAALIGATSGLIVAALLAAGVWVFLKRRRAS